jgi:hypothetical protein
MFKWKKLKNPILDNSCDVCDFLDAYIIVYQYFGL